MSPPSDLVMHDLIDALIQENLSELADRKKDEPPAALAGEEITTGESWFRVDLTRGWVCFRVHPAVLQPFRLSRTPVWSGESEDSARQLAPDELLRLLLLGERDFPGAARVDVDLRTAVEHTEVTLSARRGLPELAPRPGGLLAGELLATTRGRPFHPTARAAAGWSAAELVQYGPMRNGPMDLDWVAVRRDHLRWGAGAGSRHLHEFVLGEADQERLADAMRRTGLDFTEFQPLPVHPWQFDHVLPGAYAAERSSGEVVAFARRIGKCRPTSSLRTLAREGEPGIHVKLPLGVSTLGAARLLPPRYLDNGDRAQRTMRELVQRDDVLARRVLICDESTWCGWQYPSGADEFEDRPGQLAAQVRTYPDGLLTDPDAVVLPMAALAAHEWDGLGELFDGPPAELFGDLAEGFCELGLSFLRYGVLPELHGQNVLVVFRDGAVDRFVLRDHDTLRVFPDWLAFEGVADPGYRIKPGAPQSLSLAQPQDLLGYFQTLGIQVNLFGIADALARHYGIAEEVFWRQLHTALTSVVLSLALRDEVVGVIEREVMASQTWPSRLVLGPLLRGASGSGVSMPAGRGLVPNPLRGLR